MSRPWQCDWCGCTGDGKDWFHLGTRDACPKCPVRRAEVHAVIVAEEDAWRSDRIAKRIADWDRLNQRA